MPRVVPYSSRTESYPTVGEQSHTLQQQNSQESCPTAAEQSHTLQQENRVIPYSSRTAKSHALQQQNRVVPYSSRTESYPTAGVVLYSLVSYPTAWSRTLQQQQDNLDPQTGTARTSQLCKFQGFNAENTRLFLCPSESRQMRELQERNDWLESNPSTRKGIVRKDHGETP